MLLYTSSPCTYLALGMIYMYHRQGNIQLAVASRPRPDTDNVDWHLLRMSEYHRCHFFLSIHRCTPPTITQYSSTTSKQQKKTSSNVYGTFIYTFSGSTIPHEQNARGFAAHRPQLAVHRSQSTAHYSLRILYRTTLIGTTLDVENNCSHPAGENLAPVAKAPDLFTPSTARRSSQLTAQQLTAHRSPPTAHSPL